jgi:hypothetical protein
MFFAARPGPGLDVPRTKASKGGNVRRFLLVSSLAGLMSVLLVAAPATAKPDYEPAYFNGGTVTINAIEVPQNAGPLAHASADFYQVVYPTDTSLWPSAPQCDPCDHQGNGIDFTDFHDHVLDSIPASPGHGEFNPLWHVFLIMPADFSPAGQAAYAALLPITSEHDVDAAVDAGVAVEIDTHFYFLCAVVSPHAVH